MENIMLYDLRVPSTHTRIRLLYTLWSISEIRAQHWFDGQIPPPPFTDSTDFLLDVVWRSNLVNVGIVGTVKEIYQFFSTIFDWTLKATKL